MLNVEGGLVNLVKKFTLSMLHAFKKRKQRSLRKLNDRILREAAINFTRHLYELAVLSYVLSKVVQKPRFLRKEYEKQLGDIEKELELAASVDHLDNSRLLKSFKAIEKSIISLEKRDKRYLIGLVEKGKLKTAATMYAQGISLGVASEMTGMDKQEILDYAGETMMFERVKEELSIKDRIKVARRFVGDVS